MGSNLPSEVKFLLALTPVVESNKQSVDFQCLSDRSRSFQLRVVQNLRRVKEDKRLAANTGSTLSNPPRVYTANVT